MVQSIRPPKMYSGLQRKKSAHQLYLKMSYLELEKTRRHKELEGVSKRVGLIQARLLEIDGEIARTQEQLNEHPAPESRQDHPERSDSTRAGQDASTDHGPGLRIKY